MNAILRRLMAIPAGFVLARLAAWVLAETRPDASLHLQPWLDHTLELVLVLVDCWVRRRVALSLRSASALREGRQRAAAGLDRSTSAGGDRVGG